MREPDIRFRKYYSDNEYRGFRKRSAMSSQVTGRIRLVFSNGQKEFHARGGFTEDALEKVFDKIDQYCVNRNRSMSR